MLLRLSDDQRYEEARRSMYPSRSREIPTLSKEIAGRGWGENEPAVEFLGLLVETNHTPQRACLSAASWSPLQLPTPELGKVEGDYFGIFQLLSTLYMFVASSLR